MTPTVSITIPSYNHARYVSEAIHSVLNQTFEDFELIIIDDGSTDDSVKCIEDAVSSYRAKDITFVSRENRGLCSTLNQALSISRGDYFCYLGCDDLWLPSKLSEQTSVLDGEPQFGACYSDCYVINGHGQVTGRMGNQYKYRGGDIYRDLVWMRFQPTSPTNLFRTKILREVGGFDENHLIEDHDLWIRIARKYAIAYVDKPLAAWRVHEGNTSKNLTKMYEYGLAVLENLMKDDPSLAYAKPALLSRLRAMHAYHLVNEGEYKEGRKFAFDSIASSPINGLAWKAMVIGLLPRTIVDFLRSNPTFAK